jgi:hypothetical protein
MLEELDVGRREAMRVSQAAERAAAEERERAVVAQRNGQRLQEELVSAIRAELEECADILLRSGAAFDIEVRGTATESRTVRHGGWLTRLRRNDRLTDEQASLPSDWQGLWILEGKMEPGSPEWSDPEKGHWSPATPGTPYGVALTATGEVVRYRGLRLVDVVDDVALLSALDTQSVDGQGHSFVAAWHGRIVEVAARKLLGRERDNLPH